MLLWLLAFVAGIGLIVWGAEAFAEHLGGAAAMLGVSSVALALLLAGAEPEELATVVAAAVKGAPGIALGDVIGANVTGALLALGLGAVLVPLPCRGPVLAYGALALPLGAVAAWIAWDGAVGRGAGATLVLLYLAYVALIWRLERRPPRLGEIAEIEEAQGRPPAARDLALAAAGVAAMILGAVLLVDAVRFFAGGEAGELRLGLSVVGFATGFELVVLAWSTARRGRGEAAVAAVMGSFAYNATMTLGAGALARPLIILDAPALHVPWVLMLGALALALGLALPKGELRRPAGMLLLALYPAFLAAVFWIR